MSETDAIVPTETSVALSDEEKAVAWWLATSSIPGDEAPLTILELAEKLGVHRNTITATAKRPQVRMKAHEMLKDFIQYDRIPKIMLNVWEKAEKDAKFGLDVLKFMRDWGIDPLLGIRNEPEVVPRSPSSGQTVVLNVPGDFEAAVRSIRRAE